MFGQPEAMPSDKLMKLFIIQTISSFVANDYDSGVHYLKEIKQTYAEKMTQLNPTLKQLAKDIIQSVDLFNPNSTGAFSSSTPDSTPQSHTTAQPSSQEGQQQPQDQQIPQEPDEETQSQPTSVASELQDLLDRRRAKRRKK